MNYRNRYSTAVGSKHLKHDSEREGDVDVIGAAGLAGKRSPLAMALLRLFVGDSRAVGQIVRLLAEMAISKAWRSDEVKLSAVEADDIARAVLAWHRHGVCRPCGGHGYLVVPGTTSLSELACPACRGTGRIPFDTHFSADRLELARWLLAEVERDMAKAGPAAMAMLAPIIDV